MGAKERAASVDVSAVPVGVLGPTEAYESVTGVTTDTGPFAIVPEWVLGLSGNAVKLYAVLRRFADDETGVAWPSRKTLGERMTCSVDTVDRILRELEQAGAVVIQNRVTEAGDLTSNLYHVRTVRQGSRNNAVTGLGMDAATGSRTDAAENDSHPEREPTKRDSSSKKEITDAFVQEMVRIHPLIDVSQHIERAKSHPAFAEKVDRQRYIRNWLARESRTAEWRQNNQPQRKGVSRGPATRDPEAFLSAETLGRSNVRVFTD